MRISTNDYWLYLQSQVIKVYAWQGTYESKAIIHEITVTFDLTCAENKLFWPGNITTGYNLEYLITDPFLIQPVGSFMVAKSNCNQTLRHECYDMTNS